MMIYNDNENINDDLQWNFRIDSKILPIFFLSKWKFTWTGHYYQSLQTWLNDFLGQYH